MKFLKLIFRFIRYYLKAKTRYNIHSPFVFEFIEKVLEDKRMYYSFEEIESLRSGLLRNKEILVRQDFGAGPALHKPGKTSIADIARFSASNQFKSQCLFRIVDLYKPKSLFELGTSLGISTLYLAAAANGQMIYTIEGDPKVARLAESHFSAIGRKNIEIRVGEFGEVLPNLLEEFERLDFCFIDGNHRKVPTLKYFEACLAKVHDNSIIIFDDIHWSEEMEEVWLDIREHPAVTLSLDLFFFGIVFFKKEFHEKEHFTLIKWSWKPWEVGLVDFLRG